MNTPRRLTANEDNERENHRRALARERQRKFRERQRQQFGRVIQRRREAPTVAEVVDQRTDHAADAAGLQLIGLINYRVPVATCIACGTNFQTEAVIPALCHEAEVIGTVCPACLTPRERAAYLRRLAERAVRR